MGVIFRSFLALFKTQKNVFSFFTALYGKIPYHCPSSKINTCVLSMLKMTHYMIRARFGMRATIVWSGSGVLALGCLLRCLSLDPEVRICICIHICICICILICICIRTWLPSQMSFSRSWGENSDPN